MKRRDLLGMIGLITAMGPGLARSQSRPCPVPLISIDGESVETDCDDVSIALLAATLSPGQNSTALGDTGLTSSAFGSIQWTNRFHYDHARNRAHLIGKYAASQGSSRTNNLYDATTNRWSSATYDGSELGHVYESFAYLPESGEIFTGNWGGSPTLKSWRHGNSLSSWTNPATTNFGASINDDTQPALCWHPSAFGPGDGAILALRKDGSNNCTVVAWRKSNNTWLTVSGTAHVLSGSYAANGAIEYVRGGNFCIATFPPSQGGKTFRINAGSGGTLATATQLNAVPIRCGYAGAGANVGMLLDDPDGDVNAYILEKGGSNRVWKLSGSGWSQQSYSHPFPNGGATSDTNWIVASVYPLGVFWSQDNSASSPSRLWRPNS